MHTRGRVAQRRHDQRRGCCVVRFRLRSVRGRPQLHSRVARVALGVLVVLEGGAVNVPTTRSK